MNILEVEDIIKGLPDQALQKEAQAPSGQVPQFLVVSEIQRRTDMRKRFQSQQQKPQGTISQQIVQEGIASIAPPPQQMMPQQPMAPQQPMPPQQMPMGQSLAQPMYRGGVVEMNTGRQATIGLPDDEEEEERYGLSISEAANNPMSIRQYNQDWEGEVGTYSSKGSGDFVMYDTPAHSIRAGDRLLRTFQRDAGVDTIRKAISKYAPQKGDDGYTNPTNKYIEYVSQQSGIDPDEPLDFEDPVTRSRLVSPMAFFESNTVLSPSEVRDTIASVDEEYAATLPQRDVPFTPPRVESGIQVPTEGFPVPNVQTKDPRLPLVSVEKVEPENQYAGVESTDALLNAIMEGKVLPERTGSERRGSLSRLPVADREAGAFTKSIANAIEEDAKRTKESDVQDKEQIEAVEAFTSGSTSLPAVVGKVKKKVDLFAGARRAEELLASMSGPERAAELVKSIEKNRSVPKASVDVGGLIDLIQPKEGSLDVGKVDLSPTPRVNQIEILKDDFRRKFNREMPRYLIKQALETGRYDNPNISPESEEAGRAERVDPIITPSSFATPYTPKRIQTFDPNAISLEEANKRITRSSDILTDSTKSRILERIPPQYRRMMQDTYMERHGVPMPDDVLIDSYLQGKNTYTPPADERSISQKINETPKDAIERYKKEVEEDPLALSGTQQKRIEQGDDAVEAVKKQLEKDSKATTATAKTDQQLTDQAVSGAKATSSGDMYDLMREIAGTREQAKKEAFANAMIQLGAGVASGNLAAGLSAAGKAASETMSDYRDRALKGRLAELQLKKADIQEARYARSEDLAERREKRYLIAAADKSIKEQTDNLLVKVSLELEARLGRTPTDAEIANAMEDARQRIIDAAATTYGLDRRLLGGVSVTPEEEDDDAPTTQYQTDPSAPKLVDVN